MRAAHKPRDSVLSQRKAIRIQLETYYPEKTSRKECISPTKAAFLLYTNIYVVTNGLSRGKLPSAVGYYVHPSARRGIKIRIYTKPNFGRIGRVRLHVDSKKSLPRGVNGDTAVARFVCIDICPPADHHLPGVKDDAIQHTACTADTTLIDMTNQGEETGFMHTISSLDRSPRGQEQVYGFPSGIRRPQMVGQI